ncbi:MAG: nucleotidyl transferase AbiEii/AbiGii toxin family protein [Candidatus Marinimicrobia bacterium]|nr:nucleotidyl transferase AbiEii/AbiGii toxin family protein [Candidatus Neomarinimicrobiota bacterium]
MNPAIEIMLQKYSPETGEEYVQALREILQEIALLGLSRAKFFEKAAFYGGTAMRIMYKLDRFSEDMDFSLLLPNKDFDLGAYENAVVRELKAYGFESEFRPKEKVEDSAIKSAFLKANTKESLLAVEASPEIVQRTNRSQNLKIKVEIDTDPPPDFKTEVLQLYNPIPYSVKTYVQRDPLAHMS